MDPRPAPGCLIRPPRDDGGFASLQFVVAAGLAMLMVVGLVQFVAYQYARGAVVAALERGVRAGAVAGAGANECEAALTDSLSEVLGGEIHGDLAARCGADESRVWAEATATLPSWLPGIPDLAFSLDANARRESEP